MNDDEIVERRIARRGSKKTQPVFMRHAAYDGLAYRAVGLRGRFPFSLRFSASQTEPNKNEIPRGN